MAPAHADARPKREQEQRPQAVLEPAAAGFAWLAHRRSILPDGILKNPAASRALPHFAQHACRTQAEGPTFRLAQGIALGKGLGPPMGFPNRKR